MLEWKSDKMDEFWIHGYLLGKHVVSISNKGDISFTIGVPVSQYLVHHILTKAKSLTADKHTKDSPLEGLEVIASDLEQIIAKMREVQGVDERG